VKRGGALAGLHIAVIVVGLALGAYVAFRVATNSDQWLRIGIWFAAAIIVHDLVAFPVYATADRVLVGASSGLHRIGLLNHLRVPALGSALLLVVFLPQIIGQGDGSFTSASGLSPGPYLARWLVVTAVLFAISAVAYGTRVLTRRRA